MVAIAPAVAVVGDELAEVDVGERVAGDDDERLGLELVAPLRTLPAVPSGGLLGCV